VVGISFDTPADNKVFTEAQGFGFPLLCDVDRSVGRLYGAERGADASNPDFPKRITFLIDPAAKIVKVYEVADAGAHPEEVLQDLRELVAGPTGAARS